MVDNFEQYVEFIYVYPNIGRFKLDRGKFHKYLSMTLDYNTKVEVNIDKRKYVKNMIDEFTINIKKSQAVTSPDTNTYLRWM